MTLTQFRLRRRAVFYEYPFPNLYRRSETHSFRANPALLSNWTFLSWNDSCLECSVLNDFDAENSPSNVLASAIWIECYYYRITMTKLMYSLILIMNPALEET